MPWKYNMHITYIMQNYDPTKTHYAISGYEATQNHRSIDEISY